MSAEEGYRLGRLYNYLDGFYRADFFQIGQIKGFEDGVQDGYEDAQELLFDQYQKPKGVIGDDRTMEPDSPEFYIIQSYNHGYSYEYLRGYDIGVEQAVEESTAVQSAFSQYLGFKFGKEIGAENARWNAEGTSEPVYQTVEEFLTVLSLEVRYSNIYETANTDYWNGVLAGFPIGWNEYRANNPVQA